MTISTVLFKSIYICAIESVVAFVIKSGVRLVAHVKRLRYISGDRHGCNVIAG